MDEKIKSIEKNNIWELPMLPKGHKVNGVKWAKKIARRKVIMKKDEEIKSILF